MKKIFGSTLIIVGVLALVAGASGAFFSDTERSSGNTFASGVIDLMVGNESYYNGVVSESTSWVDTTSSLEGKLFFNFDDVKPDDEGEDTIALTVDTNDAWACMSVELTTNDDMSSIEPELTADDDLDDPDDLWDGELADHLEFLWWADDGDNVYEQGETLLSNGAETLTDLATTSGPFMVALADSMNINPWTQSSSPLEAGETYHVGKVWCFGSLSENPLPQDGAGDVRSPIDENGPGILCDGTGIENVNQLQTDSVTLDVSFLAMQARHDSEYMCPNPEPEPIPCDSGEQYADSHEGFVQGLQRNGGPVKTVRSDPSAAYGAPEDNGNDYTFFAIGFAEAGETSHIILSFDDNYVIDGPGNDLKIYERTGPPTYPVESITVEVSNDLTNWTTVGTALPQDAEIDLGAFGVTIARYVRLTDATDTANFPTPQYDTADAYDVDAIEALNCIVSPIN